MILLSQLGSNIQGGNYNKDKLTSSFPKVFDWLKASKIIKQNQIQNASVALGASLEKTYPILKNGKPLKSNEDVSEFNVDHAVLIDDDTGQIISCFYQLNEQNIKNMGYNRSTPREETTGLRWPNKAIEILINSFYYKDTF